MALKFTGATMEAGKLWSD